MTEEASALEEAKPPPRPAGVWIRLLRVGGIGVYVEPLVVTLLALLFLGGGGGASLSTRLTLFAIALGSVFLHEAGHAFMARRRGLTVSGIFLHLVPFAYVERGHPADELRVALAGPAVNLVISLGLLCLPGVAREFPWLQLDRWLDDPLWAALGINLLMGTVNLIPALPMDGGRALRAGLSMVMAPARAYARTARVGTFVGSALLFVALLLGRWPASALAAVLGLFVCMVAWREARAGQRERSRERASKRS